MVTIYLVLPLPEGSSDQPGDWAGHPVSLYLVLLRMGFAQPAGHPAAGELLPRHFALAPIESGWYVSVALSVGLPLLDVIQHPARAELGLSSPILLAAVTRFTQPIYTVVK